MRHRCAVAKAGLLVAVLSATAGCAIDRSAPGASTGPMVMLTGRVLSTREVTGMMGDVAVVWDAYVVVRMDGPGDPVTVIDATASCGVPVASGATYRFRLQRARLPLAVTMDAEPPPASDLLVVACEPLGLGQPS
ncbi:hypothetical protein [Brevundimonas subvibrioides]|uniref:hypothetical protein n=1 Tax=Brevundimonas subvibrioides TaxID=74313 RepID=UPI0032D5ACDD